MKDREHLQTLQDFLLRPPCSVIYALSDAVDGSDTPEKVDFLAPILYNLFGSQGREVELLSTLLEREVAITLDACTLLRRNSLATKTLQQFLKRVGREYMVEVLGPPIAYVRSSSGGFEMDTNRIKDDEVVEDNAVNLRNISERFFRAIFDSIDRMPPALRHVCKNLHDEVAKKFPGSEISSAGSLIFLRYFCPAMVAPEEFGIIDPKGDPLPREKRRCLILVSKIIQNVANGIATFKEKNMQLLNNYLSTSITELNKYLYTLVREDLIPSLKSSVPEEGLLFSEMSHLKSILVANIHVIAKFLSISREQRQKALNRVRKAEKRGYLKKRGENVRNYRKRWFILKGDLLYYYKREQDSTPLGVIPLPSDLDSIVPEEKTEDSGDSTGFIIISPLRTYYIRADSTAERKEWLQSLTNALREHARAVDCLSPVVRNNSPVPRVSDPPRKRMSGIMQAPPASAMKPAEPDPSMMSRMSSVEVTSKRVKSVNLSSRLSRSTISGGSSEYVFPSTPKQAPGLRGRRSNIDRTPDVQAGPATGLGTPVSPRGRRPSSPRRVASPRISRNLDSITYMDPSSDDSELEVPVVMDIPSDSDDDLDGELGTPVEGRRSRSGGIRPGEGSRILPKSGESAVGLEDGADAVQNNALANVVYSTEEGSEVEATGDPSPLSLSKNISAPHMRSSFEGGTIAPKGEKSRKTTLAPGRATSNSKLEVDTPGGSFKSGSRVELPDRKRRGLLIGARQKARGSTEGQASPTHSEEKIGSRASDRGASHTIPQRSPRSPPLLEYRRLSSQGGEDTDTSQGDGTSTSPGPGISEEELLGRSPRRAMSSETLPPMEPQNQPQKPGELPKATFAKQPSFSEVNRRCGSESSADGMKAHFNKRRTLAQKPQVDRTGQSVSSPQLAQLHPGVKGYSMMNIFAYEDREKAAAGPGQLVGEPNARRWIDVKLTGIYVSAVRSTEVEFPIGFDRLTITDKFGTVSSQANEFLLVEDRLKSGVLVFCIRMATKDLASSWKSELHARKLEHHKTVKGWVWCRPSFGVYISDEAIRVTDDDDTMEEISMLVENIRAGELDSNGDFCFSMIGSREKPTKDALFWQNTTGEGEAREVSPRGEQRRGSSFEAGGSGEFQRPRSPALTPLHPASPTRQLTRRMDLFAPLSGADQRWTPVWCRVGLGKIWLHLSREDLDAVILFDLTKETMVLRGQEGASGNLSSPAVRSLFAVAVPNPSAVKKKNYSWALVGPEEDTTIDGRGMCYVMRSAMPSESAQWTKMIAAEVSAGRSSKVSAAQPSRELPRNRSGGIISGAKWAKEVKPSSGEGSPGLSRGSSISSVKKVSMQTKPEGFLMRKEEGPGIRDWSRFWFEIRDFELHQFKNERGDASAAYVSLCHCVVREVPEGEGGTGLEFDVVDRSAERQSGEASMRLQCSSRWDYRSWTTAIKKAKVDYWNMQKNSGNPISPVQRQKALGSSECLLDARGYLMKQGGQHKNWKRRWFVFNGIQSLMYFEEQQGSVPLGSIPLGDSTVRDSTVKDGSDRHNLIFEIATKQRVYVLQASNVEDKRTWKRLLKVAKAEYWKYVKEREKNAESGTGDKSLRKSMYPGSGSALGGAGRDEAQAENGGSALHATTLKKSRDRSRLVAELYDETKPRVKEGWLYKQGAYNRKWKMRWFILQGDYVFYFSTSQAGKECLGAIALQNSTVRMCKSVSTLANVDFGFEIVTASRIFYLGSNDEEDARQWISSIEGRDTLSVKTTESSSVTREGWLMKQGGKVKNWKRRWFVIRGNVMHYFSTEEAFRHGLEPAGAIPLSGCSVVFAEEKMKKQFCFEISTRFRNYFLVAENELDLAGWMQSVGHAASVEAPRAGENEVDSMAVFEELSRLLTPLFEEAEHGRELR